MEYKEPKVGVILYDVSETDDEIVEKWTSAASAIHEVYPSVDLLPSYYHEPRMARIGDIIRQFGYADTLFCNTCGDEIDHLYRFVRAIAKNEGLQIIPMKELREKLEAKV